MGGVGEKEMHWCLECTGGTGGSGRGLMTASQRGARESSVYGHGCFKAWVVGGAGQQFCL